VNPAESFKALYDIVAKLRSPGGCPWDREQTPSTLREALIEETFECLEAIDEKDPTHIAEELGDLFLVVTMLGYIYEEEGNFSVAASLANVNEKLIRRHPHVFGEKKANDTSVISTDEVLNNWESIKINQEGRKPKESVLDDVRPGFPPMDRAWKLQKKAAKVGFDWQDIEGVISKIREELDEVQEVVKCNDKRHLEEELGDLLFSVINLCRFLKVDPSVALRRTNSKFISRFKYMEKKMKETGQEMNKENIGIMDGYWNEAKSI